MMSRSCVLIIFANAQVENAKKSFWEFCEGLALNLSRNDVATWDKRWPANSTNGIFSSYGFNHSEFCWATRLLPSVKRAFSAIWRADDLLVSFDAGNVFRPWKANPLWLTDSQWWHVDQNALKGPDRVGRVCVQGFVTYYDATPETGGLCVIPGSHKFHDEVCARSSDAQFKMDFVKVRLSDPILQQMDGLLVAAKAGDLVLWDSRTIHCNTHALDVTMNQRGGEPTPSELIRLVSYVCMLPKSLASPAALESRKEGFRTRTPTSHWPTNEVAVLGIAKGKRPVDVKGCPDEMLHLVGYDDHEIQKLRENSTCCIQ